MSSFKDTCVRLRKQNLTLNEIVKITGRPKTSVYSHIYNIPLSSEKVAIIKQQSGLRIRQFAINRKGKSHRKFKKFFRWNKESVIFTAHFIFDGEIKYGSCIYNNRNLSLLNKVSTAIKSIYEFEPILYLNKETNVYRISYHNVALSNYLKEKSIKLLENIKNLPKKLKIEFVRAFFDDEGCIDFRPKKNSRRIRGYQKNIAILNLIRSLLLDLGINSKVVEPNEVVITGKENLVKFQKEINFSVGVRLNGRRSNSIWKKSLEKRILLDKAIKSFKS